MAGYEERLTPDLVMRTVRDARDIERFAAFNTAINDTTQGLTCANLLRHHPQIIYDDFFLVEDERSGEVVSTICLIPWRCLYAGVQLNVAMLEMVATHPDYRHHGLVRAQINRFHQVVGERGFDLCIIEGIPYYYRQYGYAYATDHWRMDSLPVWRIPEPSVSQVDRYHLRPATLADIPVLTQLYQEAMAPLAYATLRTPDYWHYLLAAAQYPVQMVAENANGRIAGYLTMLNQPNPGRARIVESAIADATTGLALLQQLKQTTSQELQIGWPQSNTLLQLARSLGSTPIPGDQWLLRIPDLATLLTKLAPVFEERLATSSAAQITTDLCLNLFRQAYVLRFVSGKLLVITNVGFVDASMGADGGDLCIPPDAFVRLLFGYRTLDQLVDAWPDIVVKLERRLLIETLFPPLHGYFWLPYLYYERTLRSA